jgi:hypothetical protein
MSLLNAVLANVPEPELESLLRDELLTEEIEETLAEDVQLTSAQLARVLIYGNVPVARLLQSGCRVLPLLDGVLKADLALRMLGLGLSRADSSENSVLEEVISESGSFLDTHQLIALAIPLSASVQRVSDNIVLLDQSNSKIRADILSNIEDVCDRLIARANKTISDKLVRSWANLLADAGAINPHGQVNAAGRVLSFALANCNKPMSPLIVVAFPIVYKELRAGKEPPGLFSFLFTDWDRCKTARKNIIKAFLESHWSPLDLIKAVEPTGDLHLVLSCLLREPHGKSLMRKLQAELSELPAQDREWTIAVIDTALHGNHSRHGDDRNQSQ